MMQEEPRLSAMSYIRGPRLSSSWTELIQCELRAVVLRTAATLRWGETFTAIVRTRPRHGTPSRFATEKYDSAILRTQ
jgi:hypothetical protein